VLTSSVSCDLDLVLPHAFSFMVAPDPLCSDWSSEFAGEDFNGQQIITVTRLCCWQVVFLNDCPHLVDGCFT
jgi:hypothetical protein